MSTENELKTPAGFDDQRRAEELSLFLTSKRWTVGQAKKAMALWYEEIGVPPEHGPWILASDLQDFQNAIYNARQVRR